VARRRGEWEQAREERRRAIQQALKSGEILAAIGRVLGVSRQRVKRLAEGE
jgi:hypothetical protein